MRQLYKAITQQCETRQKDGRREAGHATGGWNQRRVLIPLPWSISDPSCSCQLWHKVWSMNTFGLMNVLHLPSVSGITRGNGRRAVQCQRPVWWYHQRWPLVPPTRRGVWGILARTTTLSKPRFAVALCTDMRLRLSCAKNHCQNRISVSVSCHITGLFLYRQLWAVVRPIRPRSHLVEIDSPFAS